MSDIPLSTYKQLTEEQLKNEKEKLLQSKNKELNDGMQLLNQMKDKKDK
jgi:hypothetical protein